MVDNLKLKIMRFFTFICSITVGLFYNGNLIIQAQIFSPQESRAIKIIQDKLNAQGPFKAEPLTGGYSGATLIKITVPNQTYVVRFLDTKYQKQWNDSEISCQQIVSEQGCAPYVYFSDINEQVIVMEYLAAENFPTDRDRLKAYVNLVKKIHSGPAFSMNVYFFERVLDCIKSVSVSQQNFVDLALIKTIVESIQKVCSCFPHIAPCHRDLHASNVIYSRGKFFAIDYGEAGQDDPFIDLAAPLFHRLPAGNQKIVLAEYFGRLPTERELAKWSLMKSVVLIFYGIMILKHLPEGFLKKIKSQEIFPKPYEQMSQQIDLGILDFNNPLCKLECALGIFAEVLNHYNSDQFNHELILVRGP